MGSADKFGEKRAQVSLEFLVLLAAFLAFTGVWLSLIFSVEHGITKSLEYSKIEALASDIREAADAICLMGPGSSKEVKIGLSAKLEFSGKEMKLSSGGKVVKKPLRCETFSETAKLAEIGMVFLENVEGKIRIKK
ncbi:MAG: class III signal peptide-containing protein [Candidatus Micrarchaeota archaeon]